VEDGQVQGPVAAGAGFPKLLGVVDVPLGLSVVHAGHLAEVVEGLLFAAADACVAVVGGEMAVVADGDQAP
jgi:hypothetical protein